MPRFYTYEAEYMLTDNGVKLRIINMLGNNVLTNNEEVLEVTPATTVWDLKTLLAARARVCRRDPQSPDKIELILQRDTSGSTAVQAARLARRDHMGRVATLEHYGITELGKTYTIHAVCQTPRPRHLRRHAQYRRGGRHCRKTRRCPRRPRRPRRKKTKHRRRRRRKTRRRRRRR